MKKIISCLSVLVMTFLSGFGFYSYSPTGIAETEVLDLTKQLHQAEQMKDEGKLQEIFAEEISWSRYRDERFITKEQVIENIKNSECKFESTETAFVFTTIEYGKVRVSFLMNQKFVCADGNQSEHRGNYIYTFEKQQNKWKLTTIHLEN